MGEEEEADFWRDSVGGREDPKCRVTCGRGLIWIREAVGQRSTDGQVGPDDGVEFCRPCWGGLGP